MILDCRFGGHDLAAALSMFTSVLCFVMIGFMTLPIWPVTLLAGICYGTLPAALYPLFANSVPDESFAHVYAFLTACINIVLAASTLCSGAFSDISIDVSRRLQLQRTFVDSSADPLVIAQDPNYTFMFVLLVVYCIIGTATTAWPLWRKMNPAHPDRTRITAEHILPSD